MIIWGTGKDNVVMRHEESRDCPVCGGTRNFRLLLTYEYFHLYWIFALSHSKKYMWQCTNCQNGIILPKGERPAMMDAEQPNLPFMRRFGLAVFGLIIVGIFAYAVYSGNQQS